MGSGGFGLGGGGGGRAEAVLSNHMCNMACCSTYNSLHFLAVICQIRLTTISGDICTEPRETSYFSIYNYNSLQSLLSFFHPN